MKYDTIKMSYNEFRDFCKTAAKIFDERVDLIPDNAEWKRIKYNSCYFVKVQEYVFLKSYNTIVAYYDTFSRNIIIYGYYSSTTCHHVSKFMRLLNESGYEIDIITYLYERSDQIACIDNQFQYITKWYKSLK